MTNQQAPEALHHTKYLTVVYRDIKPGDEARELIMHPKMTASSWSHVMNERDRLHTENTALQQGYAAARLEIESLQARIKTMAEEHADELTVAHLDGRMRAAQPAGAQAAPAAVAGPSEFPHEQMDAVALARYKVVPSHESMFHRHAVVAGDGSRQLYIGREVECQNMAHKFAGAFLDGAFAFHSMLAAAPTTQPAPQQEPSYTAVQLAELVLSDCGHSSNYVPLLERVAARIDAHVERCLESKKTTQQEAQEPVAWYVTGCGRLLDEDEAKAEARHIGGTARAIPLYTAPQADSVQDLQPVHDAVTIDLLNERVAYLERKLKEADSVLEDAARYRYLTRSMGDYCVTYADENGGGVLKAAAADAAIDAARTNGDTP